MATRLSRDQYEYSSPEYQGERWTTHLARPPEWFWDLEGDQQNYFEGLYDNPDIDPNAEIGAWGEDVRAQAAASGKRLDEGGYEFLMDQLAHGGGPWSETPWLGREAAVPMGTGAQATQSQLAELLEALKGINQGPDVDLSGIGPGDFPAFTVPGENLGPSIDAALMSLMSGQGQGFEGTTRQISRRRLPGSAAASLPAGTRAEASPGMDTGSITPQRAPIGAWGAPDTQGGVTAEQSPSWDPADWAIAGADQGGRTDAMGVGLRAEASPGLDLHAGGITSGRPLADTGDAPPLAGSRVAPFPAGTTAEMTPSWNPPNAQAEGAGGDDEFSLAQIIRDLVERTAGGGVNSERLHNRREAARENLTQGQVAAMGDLRGVLADRGLLGTSGHPEGAELDATTRAFEPLQRAYLGELRQSEFDESIRADEAELDALSQATGWSRDQAAQRLAAADSAGGRQQMLSEIALGVLDRNITWNKFLAEFGLSRESLANEIRRGNIDSIGPVIQMMLQLLAQSRGGYI